MQQFGSRNRSTLYSRILLSAAAFVVAVSVFLTYKSFTNFRQARAQSQELIRAEGNLRYCDAVLTMSARAYAFTGDPRWRVRHDHFQAKLTAELKSTADLLQIPNTPLTEVSQTAERLTELEGQSLALVGKGLRAEAQQILLGKDYERIEEEYARSLDRLNQQIDASIASREKHLLQNTLLSVFFVGALLVIFFLMFFRTFRALDSLLLMQDIRSEISRRMLFVDPSGTEDDLHWALRLIVSETNGDRAFLLRRTSQEGTVQIQQWWDHGTGLSDDEVTALWACLEQLHEYGAIPLRNLSRLSSDEREQFAPVLQLELVKILSAYVEAGQGEEYYLCWGAKKRTSMQLTPDDAFLQSIAKIMIGAIKYLEYEATLTHLAMTDSLTRVYNRHHFTECLAKALEQHRRTKQPYALLMLDLDHFKDINDTYGHPAGDAVLQYFASTLRGKLREIDTIGRLGGEEFGVILPDTDAEAALSIAERLREDMQNAEVFIDGEHIGITVCIGVTVLDEGDVDTGQPMSRADDALYCAKEEGRNRVKWKMPSNERTDLSI